MMLNGALANVTQPLKHFDESDTSPRIEGFIKLLNIQFGLLNFCQIFGKLFFFKYIFRKSSILAQTQGLLFNSLM